MLKWRYVKKILHWIPRPLKNWLYLSFGAEFIQAVSREYLVNQFFISSYPLVSGDTFRSICDLHFDENTKVQSIVEEIKNFDSNGDLKIFISGGSNYAQLFHACELNKIDREIKFIYHNSDKSMALNISSEFTKKHRFYSINSRDRSIVNIPLGLDNIKECRYGRILNHANSNIRIFKSIFAKETMVLINFREETNRILRNNTLSLANKYDFVKVANNVDIQSNIRNIQSSYFVLSPAGSGIDCFRNFESMYLGAVPVVQQVDQLPYMTDLPILIVESFKDFLELNTSDKIKMFMDFHNKFYPKLHFDFWNNLIRSRTT